MLLAGDIGGTKTILALYTTESGARKPLIEQSYASGDYGCLEDIIENFLKTTGKRPDRACFGVAGPVVRGEALVTNLSWMVGEHRISEMFDFSAVHLLNDLQSIAYSVPRLVSEDVHILNDKPAVPAGNIAVIAPGTGLGEAYLTWNGIRYAAHASEGGHGDFAPQNAMQIGLLQNLQKKYGHVSTERVCSGSGIPNIYAYIKDSGLAEESPWLSRQLASAADPVPLIMQSAVEEPTCTICRLTLDTFVAILAAEAGNLALRNVATGGLYLGGGIPPKLLPELEKPLFMESFSRKGRVSPLLEEMRVTVILNPEAALLGAASFGLDRIED